VKAASTPTVSLSASKGLAVKSPPPGDVEVRFRGLVQVDSRFYFDDNEHPQNDTFLFRRVEPTIEGTWGDLIAFRLNAQLAATAPRSTMPIWTFGSTRARPCAWAATRCPSAWSGCSPAAPSRWWKAALPASWRRCVISACKLQGDFLGSALSYQLGVFNGAPDGRDGSTTNPDNDFELVARLFAEPWKNAGNALSGLGFGIAGSSGDKQGSGNSFLPRYTARRGRCSFFNYLSNVVADGEHTRWTPQAYYYRNAFGALGEYNQLAPGSRTADWPARSHGQSRLEPHGQLRADR
jgi:phosphate-selective porin OprO/OprP